MSGKWLATALMGLSLVTAGCAFEDDVDPATLKPKEVEPGPDDPDAPEEFTVTESGLKYRILRDADGPKPKGTSDVRVHYKGWLDGGMVFDSSYARGKAASFGLQYVIQGWTEGLQYCPEGGKIELEVPYQLGYGKEGREPMIPPESTLHFIVELKKIIKM